MSMSVRSFCLACLACLRLGPVLGHFTEETEVSLADGTRRQLKDLRVGDEVQSFDAARKMTTSSTVVAIFEDWHPREELIRVSLPGNGADLTVTVTAAQPLWSSSKGRVVSFSPQQTQEEYGSSLDGEVPALALGLAAGKGQGNGEGEGEGKALVLEGEQQEPVAAAVQNIHAGDVVDFPHTVTVRVLTLGLHPHHWFYANGVRVHNKGCFLGDAAVTMADGSRRPLAQISPGEVVASWDEVAQRPSAATVRARPSFRRHEDELVQIELGGGGRLLATDDHPLWSRGRQQLVSLRPNGTREAYGLPAELLQLGEELENEAQQGLPVVGLRRPFPSPNQNQNQGQNLNLNLNLNPSLGLSENQNLSLGLGLGQLPALGLDLDQAGTVTGAGTGTGMGMGTGKGWLEVQTLCLQQHHWFYVEGVRVHNKGCFLADAEVTLADGSRKPLGEISSGESVASWDDEGQVHSVATVRARPSFQRRAAELVEIQHEGGGRLLATEDHPIWSRSRQRLVSLQPNGTRMAYGLSAEQLLLGEELESEALATLTVLGLRRPFLEDTTWLEVLTLCLEPHHWFYVEGVRVHNKGCFLAEAEVTLADGSRKPLGEISNGDSVASWDDEGHVHAVATVRARPSFQRRAAELVEIRHAGGGRLLATEDHPLWSRSRQRLVSLQPNGTRTAYGLSAELLLLDEELESESLKALTVLGLQRPFLGSTAWVEVQTLCLEPHHWFYVEGVRVHNKGCFAPWTPILMADGQEKPIESIKVNDQVASWDEERAVQSVANVAGVEVFPAGDLMEISLHAATSSRRLAGGELILTPDHPIYSSRAKGMVSMDPHATLERYGLHVSQMQSQELLQRHQGSLLEATVRNWSSALDVNVSRVMTLRLEGHHWFYAQGVRVHNKGLYSGSRRRTQPELTRQGLGDRGYVRHILWSGGRRRRYGTYLQEEGCVLHSSTQVDEYCKSLMSSECSRLNSTTCCYDCLACEHEACSASLAGCDQFLASSFETCEVPWNPIWLTALITILGVIFAMGVVLHFLYRRHLLPKMLRLYLRDFCECWGSAFNNCPPWSHSLEGEKALQKLGQQRGEMQPSQGPLPSFLKFSGHYTENRETLPATYQLSFIDGLVSGTGFDDDGPAEVDGKVCLPKDAAEGDIRWLETRPGVKIELMGTLKQLAPGTFTVEASYLSSYQSTRGTLTLTSQVTEVEAQVAASAPATVPPDPGHLLSG